MHANLSPPHHWGQHHEVIGHVESVAAANRARAPCEDRSASGQRRSAVVSVEQSPECTGVAGSVQPCTEEGLVNSHPIAVRR